MPNTYNFQKIIDGKISRISFTVKKDGSLLVRYFKLGYPHATEKSRKMSSKNASKLWFELTHTEGYQEV